MAEENLPRAICLAIATAFVGALAAASVKYISSEINTHVMICTQYLICLLSLSPWIRKQQLNVFVTKRFSLHFFRAFVGWVGFYTYYYALSHIPLVDAGLLRNTAPLCVPFIVILWLKLPVEKSRWLGIIVGFIGVGIILKPSGEGLNLWHFVGFLSGLSLALSMVCTRQLAETEPSNQILFYYFFLSFLFSLPLAVPHLSDIPITLLPFLLFVGASIFITMNLYTRAYSLAPTSTLAPFSYFGVVFAGLLGWLIWDHTPDLLSLVGIALVVLGGILSLVFAQKQQI